MTTEQATQDAAADQTVVSPVAEAPEDGDTAPEESPEGASAPEEPEKSREQERQEFLDKFTKQDAAIASLRGNLKKQAERDAQEMRRDELLGAIADHLADPSAAPETFKKARASIQEKSREQLLQASAGRTRDGYYAGISKALGKVSLEASDSRLKPAQALWGEGDIEGNLDLDKLFEASQMVNEVVMQAIQEAADLKVTEARQKYNQETGSLEVGSLTGTPPTPVKSWAQAQKIKKPEELSDEAYANLVAAS